MLATSDTQDQNPECEGAPIYTKAIKPMRYAIFLPQKNSTFPSRTDLSIKACLLVDLDQLDTNVVFGFVEQRKEGPIHSQGHIIKV